MMNRISMFVSLSSLYTGIVVMAEQQTFHQTLIDCELLHAFCWLLKNVSDANYRQA